MMTEVFFAKIRSYADLSAEAERAWAKLLRHKQNRKDEAREFARGACQDAAPALATTRTLLIKSGLCETAKS